MITKEQFIDLINGYSNFMNKIDKVEKSIESSLASSFLFEYPCSLLEMVIQTNFNEEGQDHIYWWLWECDHDDSPCMWEADGTEIPMNTLDDCWEYVKDKLI